jgi:PAS domain S-box-containing protein
MAAAVGRTARRARQRSFGSGVDVRARKQTAAGRMWLIAALLFVVVFALRFVHDDSNDLVSLLYAVPIAFVAVERGRTWGLAASVLALVLFGIWDLTYDGAPHGPMDYLSRAAAFFVLGGAVGILADLLRKVSTENARFWNLSTDLLCTASLDGYFTRLNPAWERMLGWSEEELRGRPFLHFVHEDDVAATAAETASLARESHETLEFRNRYRCKDGSYRTLLWGARSVGGRDGVIYATARDISESTAAQEQLRRSEQFLESVLENLPTMVFVKEADELRFVRFNQAGVDLIGIPREELLGKNDHDLFSAQEAGHFNGDDRAVLASGEVLDIPEEPIETAGNGSRILHTRKIAIRDEHGEPRYLLGISEDITERKHAESRAEAARAEAERASQAKNEFLSRMSHELRTPLNAVIGFGQLLALDDMSSSQDEAVEQILHAGRHLLALINEVLDISRIESDTMALSLEPVHLGSVLADALSLIRPLADAAGVRLIHDPAESADLYTLADQQRLKQVLINVLSNAVKYNRRGGDVRVHCRMLADGRVEAAVADTGRGMTAAQLARLFEPFDRLGAESSGIEGTGLGLSLSLGLVEAMGGTITARSEPDVGTTMSVRLLRAEPREPYAGAIAVTAPVTAHAPHAARRTIVYVEDNLANLTLVARLLARLPNVHLIPVMKGKLALDLVREHQPDLVLLDLHLPDLHGRQVLEQLKGDPVTAGIPIVVLSADATPAQFERLLSDGAAGYLTKPIDVESLLDRVRGSLRSLPQG